MKDYAEQVRRNVESHGFHVTYVARDDAPSFCYSTGMYTSLGIPDLIISSLPPNLSHELTTQYAERFRSEHTPINQRIAARDERFDYYLIPVPLAELQDYVLASFKFYGEKKFEYLQLVFPDVDQLFPHEEGYDYDQEILGEFSPK